MLLSDEANDQSLGQVRRHDLHNNACDGLAVVRYGEKQQLYFNEDQIRIWNNQVCPYLSYIFI